MILLESAPLSEDDEDEDDLNLTNLTVVQKTRC